MTTKRTTYVRVGKGEPLPVGAVKCNVRPWKNDFAAKGRTIPDWLGGGRVRDAQHGVEVYRGWLAKRLLLQEMMRERLTGKALACTHQKDQPCHVRDVMVPFLNGKLQLDPTHQEGH